MDAIFASVDFAAVTPFLVVVGAASVGAALAWAAMRLSRRGVGQVK